MEYSFIILVWLSIGVVIGLTVSKLCHNRTSTIGVLKIDHSNPEKDIYKFEIDNLDDLNKKRRIIVDVEHGADLTQK